MGPNNWMTEALAAAVGIASLAALVVIPYWILRPIDRAAKDRRHPYQFTLADFACLFFLVQLSIAPGHFLFGEEQPQFVYVVVAYGWVASGLMWWFGVQRLSRAGVRKAWHRVIFLALVMPATLCGALGVPAMVVLTIAVMMDEGVATLPGGKMISGVAVPAAVAGALAVLWGCARFTRRIVAAASTPTPEAPTPEATTVEAPTVEAAPLDAQAGESADPPSESAHQGQHD
jgi:hypothetical protein